MPRETGDEHAQARRRLGSTPSIVRKPGYHLMFIGPKRPIVEGGTVTATLRIEKAGTREVRFDVRALGSTGAKPQH